MVHLGISMRKREVKLKKKVVKSLAKLPRGTRDRLALLVEHLQQKGVNPGVIWNNFSKLEKNKYHCH